MLVLQYRWRLILTIIKMFVISLFTDSIKTITMKNIQKLILTILLLLPIISYSQLSAIQFKDTASAVVKGAYIDGQSIATFRDSIKVALEKKYNHSIQAKSSLEGGCQRKAEHSATGLDLLFGTYGEEGIYYNVNMTTHDPIFTYPPAYVASRLIGTMEDPNSPCYRGLNLVDPTFFWADVFKIEEYFYLVITIK